MDVVIMVILIFIFMLNIGPALSKICVHSEDFGFPFQSLTDTMHKPNVIHSLPAPYCTDSAGYPIKCPVPCQDRCKTCDWDYPVPVMGSKLGAYSPSKWCPGSPLC